MTIVPAPCLQPIGVGTIVPHGDTQPSSFIDAVDPQAVCRQEERQEPDRGPARAGLSALWRRLGLVQPWLMRGFYSRRP